jgi:MFS transporter, FSR family, fosmidomycin resistance protein
MSTLRDLFRNKPLLTFMSGHFTVDMYGGILPVLYPLMVVEFNLTNAAIGLVALSYTGASSLSQPLFGYLADRFGSRYFAIISMCWSAFMVGIIGFAPSYGLLIFIAFMAGLGSGAYHPQGASNAAAAAGDTKRNSALAFYTVGGTSGYALGPIIGAIAFLILGRFGTIFLMPFGFIVAFLMLRQLRKLGLGVAQHHTTQRAVQTVIEWRPLLLVMAVVMLRSWVFVATVAFIPIWFSDQGYSPGFYSVLTTLVLGFGAAGTLTGGLLADRIGQRTILITSLLASAPFLLLFAMFPGPQSMIIGPAFAFLADMGISITLVMAQRLLPGRVGMASGFILGMGFVTGGIGVPVTGFLADRYGMAEALMMNTILVLVAAAIVMMIPRRAITDPVATPASMTAP